MSRVVKPLPGVSVVNVPCPFCGQPKGRGCVSRVWHDPVESPHTARVRLANNLHVDRETAKGRRS
jgi:hypothetical protein